MPKKSDRSDHESTMSSLIPDISLDEERSEEKSSSRTEEQNESSKEDKKKSSGESTSRGDRHVPNSQSTSSGKSASEESVEGGGQKADGGNSTTGEISQSSPAPSQKEMSGEQLLPVYPAEPPNLSEKLGLLVSTEVEDLLDEAYLTMRMEHGKKAKKSLIVEAALRFMLNDYQRKEGAESEISKWLDRVTG